MKNYQVNLKFIITETIKIFWITYFVNHVKIIETFRHQNKPFIIAD